MTDEGAAQIQPPVGAQRTVRFNLLAQQFAEQILLGEILRAHHYSACAASATPREAKSADSENTQSIAASNHWQPCHRVCQREESRFSISPKPTSVATASTAA